jgi:hypothetical protein
MRGTQRNPTPVIFRNFRTISRPSIILENIPELPEILLLPPK